MSPRPDEEGLKQQEDLIKKVTQHHGPDGVESTAVQSSALDSSPSVRKELVTKESGSAINKDLFYV